MTAHTDQDQTDGIPGAASPSAAAVERVIERFGGIRPMADKLGVPVSTVQGWKKRATIPASREADVRAAADRLGLGVAGADLDAAFPPAADAGAAASDPMAAAPAPAAVSQAPAPATDGDGTEPAGPGEGLVETAPPTVTPAAASPAAAAPSDPSDSGAEAAPPTVPDPVATPVQPPIEQKAQPDMTSSEISIASTPAPSDAPPAVTPTASSSATPPVAPPSSGSGAGAVAVAAALLAILGAGVAVTAPLWSPDFLAKSVQVDAIQSRVGALEKSLGVTASADASLGDRIAKVEAAVGAIDEKFAALPAAQVAGAVAANQLRSALAGSGPFAAELAAVKVSGIADEATAKALEPLGGHAASGIPTRSDLSERFAWIVPDIVGADLADGGTSGLGSRVMGWMTGVAGALRLPVSQTPADAQSTPALVARAGTMLDRGELAAAADLVSLLTGPAAEAAAPWLADARARLAADEATAVVGRRVAAVLPSASN